MFRIADTFTASLARLTGEEQKAVKTTAFDLQLNPATPGMRFHRIQGSKDPNFWSVRVNRDLRLIVHKTGDDLLLCYVDHHDAAYHWAERRKLETHPRTGAIQLVEVRERVEEIPVPTYVPAAPEAERKPPLFTDVDDETLLGYGVPPEWLNDVRAADEDSLLSLVEHLPAEAGEALLELATGGTPERPVPAAAGADPFEHPDAQRRFRVVADVEELERALEAPWEKWSIFLHPAQRDLVERDFGGPARVAGSAGTGKTVVALHRAVYLARSHPDARVLLTTFSDALANALRPKLRRLIGNEPRLAERLEVHAIDAIGERLYALQFGAPHIASKEDIQRLLADAADAEGLDGFSLHFLVEEWEEVVDAWRLVRWEDYRDVRRLGRKTRLPESRRAALWAVFARVREGVEAQGLVTRAEIFHRLADLFADGARRPFDFAVVDEAQDLSVPQLRFLSGLAGDRPNGLFFAGDLGQRIFQPPFSWKSLGVDIRGRSRTLRINYRTSHQIRRQADRLLGTEIADVDGNVEERRGTVSVFNGPEPVIRTFDTPQDEIQAIARWLRERSREGASPREMAVFVRSEAELERACAALSRAGLAFQVLDERMDLSEDRVAVSTMHLAKGLEFRAVVVMACDDEILPSQARIETVGDDADLEEVYNTERHLLYVACTRARDHLLVSGVEPASEFLEDLEINAE